MIKINDFNSLTLSNISYGGHGGSKRGVIINNERWFLKYPKLTKSMGAERLHYLTTPLSEYLGSQIYKSIGIETHDTMLGIANDKLVVACKDFLNNNEYITDYNMIKNEYDENIEITLESLSTSTKLLDNHNLEELLTVMNNNKYFKCDIGLKDRFWDMFIVDAFINNNDRNEDNWGTIINRKNGNIRVSPIYDNGASFYNKSSDDKLRDIINDDFKFRQSCYENIISVYKENGKNINPLKYIESKKNIDCNNSILRIVPKIDMNKIKDIFNDIPNEYNGYQIISDIQKEFYVKTLEYKYNILLKVYNELVQNN